MNIPCKSAVTCPCDGVPETGFSSEAADQAVFLSTEYVAVVPVLGNSTWQRLACQASLTSPSSQAAADSAAYNQALSCALGLVSPYPPDTGPGGGGSGNNPVPNVFSNAEQTCTYTCPDGLPFVYSVVAGQFVGTSQADADAKAFSYACAQATARAICLSALSVTTGSSGTAYSGTITATGGQLATGSQVNNWILYSGVMPPGVTFNGGLLMSDQVTLTGTPTQSGTYPFAVQIIDPQGNTQTKQYTLTVGCAFGYSVTENNGGWSGSGVFHNFTPPAPYDTGLLATNVTINPGGSTGLRVQFESPTPKTWNFQAGGTGAMVLTNNANFSINNVTSQYAVINPDGSWTLNFSIVTNGCVPVLVGIDVQEINQSSNTTYLEWTTPP